MSHLRPAFKPIYIPSRVEHPISQVAVIVGGKIIYFEDDEPWPVCPSCSEPLIPYIQLNASSRANPDAFRQLVPPPSNHGRSVTILQLLVCMGSKSLYGTCFQAATTYATTDVSWVLRFIHLSPSQAAVLPTISLEAAESPPAAKTVTEQRKQSYARLEDKFLPVRNITAWTHANEETMHEMINWNWVNDDDAFYEEHKPAEGFKLLGYAVRGPSVSFIFLDLFLYRSRRKILLCERRMPQRAKSRSDGLARAPTTGQQL